MTIKRVEGAFKRLGPFGPYEEGGIIVYDCLCATCGTVTERRSPVGHHDTAAEVIINCNEVCQEKKARAGGSRHCLRRQP